tara:strand:- start:351 stop:509 length:159 start_codon:yes stop_codon:yes gene_type:complete
MSKIGNYVVGLEEEAGEEEVIEASQSSVSLEDMTSEEFREDMLKWMDKYTND